MKDRKPKPDVAQLVNQARLEIVERALVAYVEDIDGKVPTDGEILREGMHVQFAKTPLTTFTKDGVPFSQFYVWRRVHALAIEFRDPQDPIALSTCRIPEGEWPPALTALVAQHYERKDSGE